MFASIWLLAAAVTISQDVTTVPPTPESKQAQEEECKECPQERASDIDKDQDNSQLWETDNEQG